ncbi:unnamed protein product [Mesocestoides corti]|uniref:Proteasome component Ecm29 N-terminal domain-containing protein n=1 Tax=Mesocestoides corti TaxID=53468 RepID=A0A158QU46_MESCO|nr:unnamed protein product [Mesocestoides corti]
MGSADESFDMTASSLSGSGECGRTGTDIERLALRISLADVDEQFEKVIQKSLVFILRYLAKYEDHRKKLLELLGDVTRRLKRRPAIQLPVHELFVAYNDPENSTYLTNFSHMYIRLGYPRMPITEQICLLPVLYASLTANKPIVQRDVLLHLTLPIIGGVPADTRNRLELELHELPAQRRFINEFYSLVLLLPYTFERHIRFDTTSVIIPEGFNAYDYSRVAHERFSAIHSAADLEKYKVSIVQFYSRGFFPADESIVPLLFADADSRHSVVSAANKEVRTLSVLVDWEDEALLSRIFDWYLGRRREFDPKGRSDRRQALSPGVRIKLGTFLLRSRITLTGPLAPDLIEAAVLSLKAVTAYSDTVKQSLFPQQQQSLHSLPCPTHGANTTDQQQQQQPSSAVVNPAIESNPTPSSVTPGTANYRPGINSQRRLANHGLDMLSHLLDNATSIPTDASVRALGGLIEFVYEGTTDELVPARARGFELLSRFLAREPNYLLKDPTQLPRLFDDIAPDLKAAAANCLRRLAFTFQEAQRQNYPALRHQLAKLERLLYENMERPDPISRLVAVHFAGIIYPADHIPTRYLILQALGDKDQRVRNEARVVFSIFLDPNIANDIVYGRVKLPSFVEFVNHVVQFIRLCLLAVKGGLTSAQEKEMLYETDDEIRYRINQNVRYFLSAAASSKSDTSSVAGSDDSSGSVSASHSGFTTIPNPDQARRSIATYFRLIHVVIFARCQTSRDSPEFPNFLEEVLMNNTQDLIAGGKTIFEQMNSMLLGSARGANCRHACASIYSVVTMETEKPSDALQVAVGMLEKIPKDGPVLGSEDSHVVQGMMMGAAYLLKHLHDKHFSQPTNSCSSTLGAESGGGGKSKKSRKLENKNKSQLQTGITTAIEQFLTILDVFLVRPVYLLDKPVGRGKEKQNQQEKDSKHGLRYINASVAQSTVTALLEALAVLGQAGCLAYLPSGSSVPTIDSTNTSPLPPCGASKANLVARVALYLTLAPSNGTNSAATVAGEQQLPVMAGHQRVWFAALRTLAGLCTGEPPVINSPKAGKKGGEEHACGISVHPHLMYIIKAMSSMEEVRDPALQLAIGAAMADALLGAASPYKGLWYERTYPLRVPPGACEEASKSPAGRWLAERFVSLLTHKPGQIKPPPSMLAVALWALAMARRFGPPPTTLLPPELFINLLTENDDSLQCVAASVLGLIYDRSGEEARADLVKNLTKVITDIKRPNTSVFRELCSLVQQIGRADLALPLVVLATTPLPPTVNASFLFQSVNALDHTSQSSSSSSPATPSTPWLALCAVACAGLVRRLGRSLAPAIPRLVPRVFIRRYDMARPRLRNAVQKVWLGLILYATPNSCSNNVAAGASAAASTATIPSTEESANGVPPMNLSINAMASDLVEAHFNAIICEIKTQLGFNAPSASTSPTTSPQSSSSLSSTTQPPHSGTTDQNLRDACCLAVVALTEHPSAYKQFSGHLPSLLSGLMALVDEEQASNSAEASQSASPAEKAATAVQKLVIRALDDPSCREVATGLLPRLLPILINRALSTATAFSAGGTTSPAESRSLALDLLLAAARIAHPSSLRPALPQLTIAGLQTMASLSPARVVNVMRPSTLASAPAHKSSWTSSSKTTSKEVQMAEVLRLCIRLIDENSLSRLILPLMELIRAGGGTGASAGGGGSSASGGSRGTSANSVAAVATATCIFLSHLALSSSTLISQPSPQLHPSDDGADPSRSFSQQTTTRSSGRVISLLAQHTGKLLAALLGALPGAGRQLDSLGRKTVQEEMAQAVALLLRFAKDTSVAKVFSRVRSWFMETGGNGQCLDSASSSCSQWACVRVMHAIARCCPDLLFAHPGLTLPLSEADVLQLASIPSGTVGAEPPSACLTNFNQSSSAVSGSVDNEDLDARRALWQETWKEILPASHVATATSRSHFCLAGGVTAAAVCPLADLLKPPLLTAFVSSLSEALLRSPSWFVRNQAALALLSVSAAIVSQPMFMLTTVASSLARDVAGFAQSNSPNDVASSSNRATSAAPPLPSECLDQGDEDEECDEDDAEGEEEDDDDDDDEDDEEEEEEETVFLIWNELVRVLASALKETGAWAGKVYLLRAARMLSQAALEREFALEDPSNELISEIWAVLIRETRSGRAEFAGPGYQAEAFLALSNFAEACSRDASGLTDMDGKDDRLTRLLRLILPNGIPDAGEHQSSSKKGRQTQFQISSELTETELELAIRALGIMWPLQPRQAHLDRFVDTLRHMNFLLTQGGWRIQAAALASILAMFAKLTNEQSEQLVKKASEGKGKVVEQLGLKDLVTRLKRCVENTKSQVLREHALGTIASIIRHRGCLTFNYIHSTLIMLHISESAV